MLLSVVVPVRDTETYLTEALDSILTQTRPPAELIVVDDGSTDRSAAIASSYGGIVRVVGQPPQGKAAAVNRGIAEAQGELVASCDADDYWDPHKLEWQLAEFDRDPSLDAVFGWIRQFISPELEADVAAKLRDPGEPGPMRSTSTMLVRRAVLERFGPFDTVLRVGEFTPWYAGAIAGGMRDAMVERVVLNRRLHENNTTRRDPGALIDYTRAARMALARKRAARGDSGDG